MKKNSLKLDLIALIIKNILLFYIKFIIKWYKMEKSYTFEWEMYFELIEIWNQKLEHVWFRSYDGWFENLLNTLPETVMLPKKAKIIVYIQED